MTIGTDRRTMLRYLRMQAPMLDDDQDKGGGKGDNDDTKGGGEKKPAASDDDRKGDKGFKAITTQEDLDEIFESRLSRLRKSIRKDLEEEVRQEAEAKAAKEQGDFKTLLEKAEEKLKEYERRDAEREFESLKRKVATKVGLPEEAIARLQGESEEDLEKDAKALLKLLGPKEKAEDIDLGFSNNQRRRPTSKDDDEAWKKPEHWLGN